MMTRPENAQDAYDASISSFGSLEGLAVLLRDNEQLMPGDWIGGEFERRVDYVPARKTTTAVRVVMKRVLPKGYNSLPEQTAFDVMLQHSGQLEDVSEFLRLNDVVNGALAEGNRDYSIPVARPQDIVLPIASKLAAEPPCSIAGTVDDNQQNPWLYPDGSPYLFPNGDPWLFPSNTSL